jgi:hypothetical protein
MYEMMRSGLFIAGVAALFLATGASAKTFADWVCPGDVKVPQ